MKIIISPPESSVRHLLSESQLPMSDITNEKLQNFFGYESDGQVIGIVGVEIYSSDGLLRSLVVDQKYRSQGIGSRLVEIAEYFALKKGVTFLYLLTTTAEAFFKKRGYRNVPREKAPLVIQSTSEFSSLCPISSVFMMKQIKQVNGET
jgi:amino-acid N-acetyltransferase